MPTLRGIAEVEPVSYQNTSVLPAASISPCQDPSTYTACNLARGGYLPKWPASVSEATNP